MKVEKGSQGEGGAPGNQDEKDKEKVPAPGPGSVDKVGPSPERILGAVGYHGLLLNCKKKIENNEIFQEICWAEFRATVAFYLMALWYTELDTSRFALNCINGNCFKKFAFSKVFWKKEIK